MAGGCRPARVRLADWCCCSELLALQSAYLQRLCWFTRTRDPWAWDLLVYVSQLILGARTDQGVHTPVPPARLRAGGALTPAPCRHPSVLRCSQQHCRCGRPRRQGKAAVQPVPAGAARAQVLLWVLPGCWCAAGSAPCLCVQAAAAAAAVAAGRCSRGCRLPGSPDPCTHR